MALVVMMMEKPVMALARATRRPRFAAVAVALGVVVAALDERRRRLIHEACSPALERKRGIFAGKTSSSGGTERQVLNGVYHPPSESKAQPEAAAATPSKVAFLKIISIKYLLQTGCLWQMRNFVNRRGRGWAFYRPG